MKQPLLFPVGTTPACRYAAHFLSQSGVPLTDHPTPEVAHLLLDIPSFSPDGTLRSGGDLSSLLRMLPPDITIIGGNLQTPILSGKHTLDLLQDPFYLSHNAAITAECALRVAFPKMDYIVSSTPCLIIGWGRIGKCLGKLFKSMGADVTIAARKENDRAMAQALGFQVVDIHSLPGSLSQFRLLFNTVPSPILNQQELSFCKDCLKIDLASTPGLEGEDVVIARGLPGLYAPESSGKLIADTLLNALHL